MIEKILDWAFAWTGFSLVGPAAGPGEEQPVLRGGRLYVPPALLRRLGEEGFRDLAFYFRESHLRLLSSRLADPSSSPNDRFVLRTLLENALVAARGELALCQDTGTAAVYGWKDEAVYTGGDDRGELERGIARAYGKNHLRSSQLGAAAFFNEFDTGDNLPAQVQLSAVQDSGEGPRYRFLLIAKGGGSANKTSLFPMSKALLEERNFAPFLEEKIRALGTAACPPYRLALVVGGSSPEFNLEILKLATTEILDGAPFLGEEGSGDETIIPRRDRYWEGRALEIGERCGLGAQFGGAAFLLDARVIRLPRHAASCPVSIGVSCAAHRNLLAYIDREGLHLETLVKDPAPLLAGLPAPAAGGPPPVSLDLEKPLAESLRTLGGLAIGDRLLVSGKLLLARDAAHLKWRALLAEGKDLPAYLRRHPVYYAGPAATPPGKPVGSLGPTTAARMDPYAGEFMSRGCSLITLAKGNRSPGWQAACKKYGGFYLGTVGGAAALLAEDHVTASEIIDYPELGMEAVRLVTVRDLPAFLLIDDKGGSLY